MPLASSGATIGRERLATPPACQTQVRRMMPLSARKSVSALPIGFFFQRQALIVGRDQAGHQADIGLRQFAAGIGHRIQADIERAFAHRRELRVGLDQRGVRIDLGGDLAAAAFGHLGGEHPAQPVAEIALVDGAAGKLVRDLQRGCGMGRAGAEAQDGGRGKRGCENVAACEHGSPPERILIGMVRAPCGHISPHSPEISLV